MEHDHENPIEKFACGICCNTYGISEEDITAGFIDIATIISTVMQVLEMIRECQDRNQRIERRARSRLGRRLLVNKIATEYRKCCDQDNQHISNEDADDVANQILDDWLNLARDERDQLIPMLTTDQTVLEPGKRNPPLNQMK